MSFPDDPHSYLVSSSLRSFKEHVNPILTPVTFVYLNHMGKKISLCGPSNALAIASWVSVLKRSQVRTTDETCLPPSGTGEQQ